MLSQRLKNAVEIPLWLRNSAEEIASDSRTESVVLFGSRATGYAREESDWDVAVIHSHEENQSDWLRPHITSTTSIEHDVRFSLISNDLYERDRNALGSLGYELAHDGVLLAGKRLLEPQSAEHDLIDTDELATHLVNTYENLALTIQAILKEHPKRSKVNRKFAGTSSRCSGDTAEYVAKALCIYCETGYAMTHDLVALAVPSPREMA